MRKLIIVIIFLIGAASAAPTYALRLSQEDLVEASFSRGYLKSAEQGDADAQCNLGLCYEYGDGVEKDFREAVRWYRKSAEQGNAVAQFALGGCYKKGYGVEKDLGKAWRWLRNAAGRGMIEAQWALEGVDFSVPERSGTRDAVFVCVVANEDYSVAGVDKVPHAVNDGKVFAEYARKTLGVPARNVLVETDATRGRMRRAERWLENAVRAYPDAEVVFYYAGHGVPVVKGDRVAKKCLLPTDVPAANAERAAVDLDGLLARLSVSARSR